MTVMVLLQTIKANTITGLFVEEKWFEFKSLEKERNSWKISKTWAYDHFRTATPCLKQPPFCSSL